MNTHRVKALLHELIEENPFAIRAVLKILSVEFTTAVPTLAVTNEPRPRLLINLEFVGRECRTDEHVKALLCHEFLHVLLRHTSMTGRLTPARHLALDAVINAIIHRQLGENYSSLMSNYYKDLQDISQLLRPMTAAESKRRSSHSSGPLPSWWQVWHGLYAGKVVADDIEQLARDVSQARNGAFATVGDVKGGQRQNIIATLVGRLLGNHDDPDDAPLSDALERALDRARREMNGGGIWRDAGPGGHAYELLVSPKQVALVAWKAKTLAVLRRHLASASGAPRTAIPVQACLPVLSTSDRRSFLRATWSPFLPAARWSATAQRPEGRAQVYLDVSGSMNAEMPLIVALLGHVSAWIRRPFWAFSTHVAPAVIERGVLRAGTSGGTSLACVLEHIATTRPSAAVIVTDGYVETIPKQRVDALAKNTRIHAVVTRDGNPSTLRNAGIAYSQLGRLPS